MPQRLRRDKKIRAKAWMSSQTSGASGLCPSYPNLPPVKRRAVSETFLGASLHCHISSGCCKLAVTMGDLRRNQHVKETRLSLKLSPQMENTVWILKKNIKLSCNMWILYVATVTQLLFTLAKQQNSDSWVYLSKVCFCNNSVSQLASFLEKCLNPF